MNTKFYFIFLILFTVILFVRCKKDYYSILGLKKGASKKAIKKAFRKLSLKYHPDRVTEDEKEKASEKFTEINNAYEVLWDDNKRQIYDKYGEEGLKQRGEANFGDPTSIFESFFGGGFFGGGRRGGRNNDDDDMFGQEEKLKGEDMHIPLFVTLEDLYNGKVIQYTRIKKGHVPGQVPKKCKCKRSNMFRMEIINGRMRRIDGNDCSECDNNFKLEEQNSEILVDIEIGMQDREIVTIFGEGDATKEKMPGNIHFVLTTVLHPLFKREGDNLYMDIHIPLKEALVGVRKEINHLDGRKVVLHYNEVIDHGARRILRGKGMPLKDSIEKFGDLIVTFYVDFPKTLSKKQKEKLSAIL